MPKEKYTLDILEKETNYVISNIEKYSIPELSNIWSMSKGISNYFTEKSKEKQLLIQFMIKLDKQKSKLKPKLIKDEEPIINSSDYETSEEQDAYGESQ